MLLKLQQNRTLTKKGTTWQGYTENPPSWQETKPIENNRRELLLLQVRSNSLLLVLALTTEKKGRRASRARVAAFPACSRSSRASLRREQPPWMRDGWNQVSPAPESPTLARSRFPPHLCAVAREKSEGD